VNRLIVARQSSGLRSRLLALSEENRRVAVVLALTFGTGAVDSVSYFSLNHTFTANMSGNMALLGIGIATHFGPVAGNLFAFAGFVLGSIAGPRLSQLCTGTRMAVAAKVLSVEFVLLAALTCVLAAATTVGNAALRDGVCALLALAMGIQTTVARQLAVTDVNTTVATMTLHDLVSGLSQAGLRSERWRRRAAVVVLLVAGAAIGIALNNAWRGAGLAMAAVVVLGALLLCLAFVALGDAASRSEVAV
jgi:uncharacterized membrane protein YoaK (UPF0700 family)